MKRNILKSKDEGKLLQKKTSTEKMERMVLGMKWYVPKSEYDGMVLRMKWKVSKNKDECMVL